MLTCPVCGKDLVLKEREAFCEKGHHFDRAKEGYLNLFLSSSGGGHGDDRKMLLDRRAFLEKGYYAHLLEGINKTLLPLFEKGASLVDAGCGEGYYTLGIASFLEENGKSPKVFAFDISKEAARLCAKKMKGKGECFVASTYHIPMKEESADVITSFFAPHSEEEFLRVLKPGGYLLRAVPMEEHLFSLKKAVYENPKKNDGQGSIGKGFVLLEEKRVQKEIFLSSGEDILALFGMTPYAHKTAREDVEKLRKLTSLTVETDFGILLYRKEK